MLPIFLHEIINFDLVTKEFTTIYPLTAHSLNTYKKIQPNMSGSTLIQLSLRYIYQKNEI